MRAGNTPAQMISWLTVNDAGGDSTPRQYGIVRFTGNNVNAAGYTGINCLNYKNHRTGSVNNIYYSILGNILLGQQVIDSMEARFRNAQGDLACRLMAALQGAKMVGADTRCATNNTSSLFSFLKVAQPTDAYGNPSFKISVKTHNNDSIEPIDSLQTVFNAQHTCLTIGIKGVAANNACKIYPNPAGNELLVKSDKTIMGAVYEIFDLQGKKILNGKITSENTILNIAPLNAGVYFMKVAGLPGQRFIKN